MNDAEISKLLKDSIEQIHKGLESEEVLELQKRYEELDLIDDIELEEQVNQGKAEIEKKLEEFLQKVIDDVLSNIPRSTMYEILNRMNQDFIYDNHIELTTDFVSLINCFLDFLDEDYSFYNQLLSNEEFTMTFREQHTILGNLIKHGNDEKILMNFLNSYIQTIIPTNSSLNMGNSIFGWILESVFEGENYSQAFKNSLLENDEILSFANNVCLEKIINSNIFSKEQKIEMLMRPNIMEKIKGYSYSTLVGSLCESYEDCMRFIHNDYLFENLSLGYFLSNTKLSSDDLKKVIFHEKVLEKITWRELGVIFRDTKIDFSTLKDILFDNRIFSKLEIGSIADILECKYLKSNEKIELLDDERIRKMIPQDSFGNYLIEFFQTPEIPVMDKVAIIKHPQIRNTISQQQLESLLKDPKLPIEVATELLFDKRFFYRIINEWNEEYYPNDFASLKGPFRHDKYEFAKRLYEKNPYVARTLTFSLLTDDFLDLGFNFVEKMSRYPELASQIALEYGPNGDHVIFENIIKVINNSKYADKMDLALFVSRAAELNHSSTPNKGYRLSKIKKEKKIDLTSLTLEQWEVLTEIGFREVSLYYNSIEESSKDEIDPTLNIIPEINSIEDLNNYKERRLKLCDESFDEAIQNRDLNKAKNAYLNKYFSINIEEACEIVRMFGTSMKEFAKDTQYELQVKYVEQIRRILNIEKLDTIKQSYDTLNMEPLTFDEIAYIDQSLRQLYSKNISDSVYKVTNKIKDENGNYVDNKPHYRDFVVTENGEKKVKQVLVYEAGYDFKMLIHSTCAYGELTLINNNYFDSWNKSERKSNHGICCSLIANNNMGMAEVKDVLFGFDSWDPKALTKSAPYDLYTFNDGYDIQEGRPLTFMSAQDIIDYTRHTHNEQTLERFEIRDDKRTPICENIQPSYVIVYSDMKDEIKQKAIKCSEDMKIPIVYIDKEKIVEHERDEIDQKINDFHSASSLDTKLELLEKILLSHENNRSGLRMTNPDWLEMYFPTNKIENIMNEIMKELQIRYQEIGDVASYYHYSSKLMDILDKENNKFKVDMETSERQNYIDIPVDEYEDILMNTINPQVNRVDIPKLENIYNIYQAETPDLPLSKVLHETDISFLGKQISNLASTGLYKDIEHVERMLFLSSKIGQEELNENGKLDIHSFDLLLQCTKYCECAKVNKTADVRVGSNSATKMVPFLEQEGYSDEDIRLMQAVVSYAFSAESDYRLDKICQKYGIDNSDFEKAKKICMCLKDAITLENNRIGNPNDKLVAKHLNMSTSKKLISIAELLHRSYEAYDKHQFKTICKNLINSQYSQTEEIEMQGRVMA